MFGKLLKLMLLVNVFLRCVSESKTSKCMRVVDVIKMPFVEMSSRSTKGLLSCARLCSDNCWFLKYEESESGSGTCDVFNLRDTYYSSLKFVNISNLYKKVYPSAHAFVRVLFEYKTWNDARNFCQRLGGNLAIANSTAKVDRMVNLMNGANAWVGGKKNGTTWKWLSGEVVTPTPKVEQWQECLMLYERQLTDHHDCSKRWPSVCEYHL